MSTKPAANNSRAKEAEGEESEFVDRKLALLVIEDDENISTAITEYFSKTGYNVRSAADGVAGVESALQDHPDAIILDLMLPKMDGLARWRELRAEGAHLPVPLGPGHGG